jgi:hypothetical protein
MFGIMQHLNVVLCEDATDAADKGFVYKRPEYKPVNITRVVVVKTGTVGNNPTVDLVMEDEEGNKSVVTVTGRLLRSLPL